MRHRRPLVAGAQARQARGRRQDRGVQHPARRGLAALSRDRGSPSGDPHQGGLKDLRRSAPGRRADQQAHEGRHRSLDADRRRGVALLQVVPDPCGDRPRHDRRSLRQHHHGARGVGARQPRDRHCGEELGRLRHRPGRARRRPRGPQPAAGGGPGHPRRLRGAREPGESPADLCDGVQPGIRGRVQGRARHPGADGARRAQDHRAALRLRAAHGRRREPRHRNARGRRGGGKRGASSIT